MRFKAAFGNLQCTLFSPALTRGFNMLPFSVGKSNLLLLKKVLVFNKTSDKFFDSQCFFAGAVWSRTLFGCLDLIFQQCQISLGILPILNLHTNKTARIRAKP